MSVAAKRSVDAENALLSALLCKVWVAEAAKKKKISTKLIEADEPILNAYPTHTPSFIISFKSAVACCDLDQEN